MKHDDPMLLKLAKFNTEVRERFEIVEDTALEYAPQYFIMYIMEEWEEFNSERIIGYTDASEVAQAIAYYRSTGILRWDRLGYPRHFRIAREYEHVQPKAIYVLHTEAIMYKVSKFEEVRTPVFPEEPSSEV